MQNSLLEFLSISWVRPLWWNRGNDTWSKTASQIAKWKAESLKMWPKSPHNLPKFRFPENILRSGTNLWSALLADKVFLTLFVENFVRVGNTLVVNPDNESFTQYVRINYKIPFFDLVVVKLYMYSVCLWERAGVRALGVIDCVWVCQWETADCTLALTILVLGQDRLTDTHAYSLTHTHTPVSLLCHSPTDSLRLALACSATRQRIPHSRVHAIPVSRCWA